LALQSRSRRRSSSHCWLGHHRSVVSALLTQSRNSCARPFRRGLIRSSFKISQIAISPKQLQTELYLPRSGRRAGNRPSRW
jgi:hypothetical protein